MIHIPILAHEIEEFIIQTKPKIVVDCTLGNGGHTEIFLKNGCSVIAMDYDKEIAKSFENSSSNLYRLKQTYGDKLTFIADNFANIDKYIEKADLIFADLGLSSMQLDLFDGFAYSRNTPLIMCSDINSQPLYEKLAQLKYKDILRILIEYGEVKNASQIANNIYSYAQLKGINTTNDLIQATNLPKYTYNYHRIMAQIFQAFRIYNNNEMINLQKLLNFIVDKSLPFAFITFHSLEARAVKNIEKYYKNIKHYTPQDKEIEFNPRSRSAMLRIGY